MHEFKPKVWMTCPLCDKQSPMPDPDVRAWVGLTPYEIQEIHLKEPHWGNFACAVEAKLKEKNT